MSFRLGTIFYVFALVAAALATFGAGGILAAAVVLGCWAWVLDNRRRGKSWLLEALILLGVLGALAALLLPSVQSARDAARRSQCINNLKQIQLAILNFESANGSMPPAFLADANGKPMHSWRVLILPFLGYNALYNSYNPNEPWDGPNNSKLAAQIADVYRCPSHDNDPTSNPLETQYFAIVGPETGWPGAVGRNIRQFRDGTAKTIMVIEATGLGIHWMEPRDPTLAEAVELLTIKPRSGHRHVLDGFLTTKYFETSFRNVAFCDGHAVWLGQLDDAQIATALLTADGGESIPGEWQQHFVDPKVTTVIKWGKVWGLSVFILLSLLPAAWMRSRGKANEQTSEEVGPGEA